MDVNPATASSAMHLPSEPRQQAALLRRVHDAVLGGEKLPASPRSVISASWQRSLAAHVNPEDYRPPVIYKPDEVADVRSAHPLHAVLPLLREMLVSIADESQHIVIVTDTDATILWREGPTDLCLRADPVGLCEGTRWAEDSIGTNAMGTALALGAPVQIYSAEHVLRTLHTWTCAATPIRDPDTGCALGTIDVSGLLHALHPAVVSLVTATAQLAEGHLRIQMAVRDEQLRARNMPHLAALRGEPGALLTPSGRVLAAEPRGSWPKRIDIRPCEDRVLLDDGLEVQVEPLAEGYLVRVPRSARAAVRLPTLSLSCLRADRPVAVLDGRELALTQRRAEILTLLALHPAGLSAEQLALQLYGDHGNPATVRAEIHRLRAQLGKPAMQTKPYRLRAQVDADFLTVRAALCAGKLHTALSACQAPLLAQSDAPAIRAERDQLAVALRSAVLGHRNLEAVWTFSQTTLGQDDLDVFKRLARELPSLDPRQPVVQASLKWLLAAGE
jgi:hypothetical protein